MTWKRVSPGLENDPQVAVVSFDRDPPGDVQPEPGALADGLGGEERLEDPLAELVGTPVTAPQIACGRARHRRVVVHCHQDGCAHRHLHYYTPGWGSHRRLVVLLKGDDIGIRSNQGKSQLLPTHFAESLTRATLPVVIM